MFINTSSDRTNKTVKKKNFIEKQFNTIQWRNTTVEIDPTQKLNQSNECAIPWMIDFTWLEVFHVNIFISVFLAFAYYQSKIVINSPATFPINNLLSKRLSRL